MKPEEQQIAIAEACGWEYHEAISESGDLEFWVRGPEWSYKLPDYLQDLNAAHDMETTLWPTSKWSRYKMILRRVCERDKDMFGAFDRVRATAAQRAEAFLKTLNIWKP